MSRPTTVRVRRPAGRASAHVLTTGTICTDILGDGWSPQLKIHEGACTSRRSRAPPLTAAAVPVLTTLKNLMATPNPENPLEADIGTQYTNDRAAFLKVRCRAGCGHFELTRAARTDCKGVDEEARRRQVTSERASTARHTNQMHARLNPTNAHQHCRFLCPPWPRSTSTPFARHSPMHRCVGAPVRRVGLTLCGALQTSSAVLLTHLAALEAAQFSLEQLTVSQPLCLFLLSF